MTEWELQNVLSIEEEFIQAIAHEERLAPELKRRMEAVQKRSDGNFYSEVIHGLTGIRYPEAEARAHWEAVLAHNAEVTKKVGRKISVQVTALDYFKNIKRQLGGVKILPRQGLLRMVRFSITDELTGLYTHRHFHDVLDHYIQASRRSENSFSILFFDVDHFKAYNEAHGHLAGDVALSEIARIVLAQIRVGMDVPCRYGGEEFAVIFPKTTRETAAVAGERIRRAVEQNTFGGNGAKTLTLSGGIASCPEDGAEREKLIQHADHLLYQAKFEGRNRVLVHPYESVEKAVN